MARQYGKFYTLAGFLGRCMPKRNGGAESIRYAHEVILGLKRLDFSQQNNQAITLSVNSDGIWIVHNGLRLFMILPGQSGLNVITGLPGTEIIDWLAPHRSSGATQQRVGTDRYVSWKVFGGHLDIIWDYVDSLLPPSPEDQPAYGSFPRNFPGVARQNALEAFQAAGNYCSGYKRPRHRVNLEIDRIEFDHVLPYSVGGASTEWNIQVLCQACNRKKRARAD